VRPAGFFPASGPAPHGADAPEQGAERADRKRRRSVSGTAPQRAAPAPHRCGSGTWGPRPAIQSGPARHRGAGLLRKRAPRLRNIRRRRKGRSRTTAYRHLSTGHPRFCGSREIRETPSRVLRPSSLFRSPCRRRRQDRSD